MALMLVPAVFAARTSPVNAPAVIWTVAPARLVLSTSPAVRLGDNVTAAPALNAALAATPLRFGASLTGVTCTTWSTKSLRAPPPLLAPSLTLMQIGRD